MAWMLEGWEKDECYAKYGVDGTICSFRVYLSEVEKHCPMLPWRSRTQQNLPKQKRASVQRNLSKLFMLMYDSEVNYVFIRERITRLWPKWLDAYNEMISRWPETVLQRQRLNIIMHMGFLSSESGFRFGALSSVGGPLGELVQWSDLIAALYLLGHRLFISTEIETLKK
ncbi:unnamed protein product [Gongylonema pulchrum]|uniref:alpha-1,6-mannosyl-glycoprotein 6-beta-N-acetylglucosaminyltransferase n=1 Tax=Gongylonema pulchrum TaxID=637853 RepID=A0A183ENJ6_9BILA|nr:unnamed protein product [Gongylonema pulchrum]VDN40181.1 unnamed protein product [Gongylonema pulchrum]